MLAYVAYHADADRPTPDGASMRAYWAEKARKGDAEAAAKLVGPPFPDTLGYLYDWFTDLSQARGAAGMGGVPSLTYEGMAAWSRLTDQHPQPHEVRALFQIDGVWCGRFIPAKDAVPVSDERPLAKPWPDKKRATTPEET